MINGEAEPQHNNLDPQAIAAQEALEAGINQEMLKAGLQQLAGNVLIVAETGEQGAVAEYLGDVLADTTGKVPAVERMAAFEYLASEQRTEIDRETIGAGEIMLDNIDASNQIEGKAVSDTADPLKKDMRNLIRAHDDDVGRSFRGGRIDARGADRGHNDIVARVAGPRVEKGVKTHVDAIDSWSKVQKNESVTFREKRRDGAAHKRALAEASQVVDPSHESAEQRDLSLIIDPDVRAVAAQKLESLITKASEDKTPPEQAILDEMARKEEDETTNKLLDSLDRFAQESASRAGRAVGDGKEANRLVKQLVNEGRNGYRDARRTEDAIELYKFQTRRLAALEAKTTDISGRSIKLVRDSERNAKMLRQRIVRVRTEEPVAN